MKLKQSEFDIFRKILFDEAGINLDNSKLSLVQNRLYTRMLHHKIKSFSEYLKIITFEHKEKIQMINQITTNETYFFREKQHFDFLESIVKNVNQYDKFRVWSAASSVGAEAYSISMILNEHLNTHQWDILGTDINTEVIKKAKRALYDEPWLEKVPTNYKQKYCLKGKGRFKGKFLIDKKLSSNVTFETNNLTIPNNAYGLFDIVFLRNILIYFNSQTKQNVIDNVLLNLKIGGYIIISLTENLEELKVKNLQKISSSIYRRVS